MSKKTIELIMIGVLFAVLLVGCANLARGKAIDQGEIKLIESGNTNSQDLVSHFGQPARKVAVGTGEVWVYRRMNGRGNYNDLVVTLNSQNVVVTFSNK